MTPIELKPTPRTKSVVFAERGPSRLLTDEQLQRLVTQLQLNSRAVVDESLIAQDPIAQGRAVFVDAVGRGRSSVAPAAGPYAAGVALEPVSVAQVIPLLMAGITDVAGADFTPGRSVFALDNGTLSTTPPVSGWLRRVGTALTPTRAAVRLPGIVIELE